MASCKSCRRLSGNAASFNLAPEFLISAQEGEGEERGRGGGVGEGERGEEGGNGGRKGGGKGGGEESSFLRLGAKC